MPFAAPWRSPALCCRRRSTQRPWSLRERLHEGEITELITAYCEGATAASLATAHGDPDARHRIVGLCAAVPGDRTGGHL